ncbi:MAG: hypothetical protein EOO03_13710, partial [Chitinophagaceae bacterium]
MNWIKCIAIICATATLSSSASAQLLKKLKEKAEKAIDGSGKKSNSNSSNDADNGSSASSSASSSKSSSAKEPAGPPTNGKVVFSMEAEETLLYDETAVAASNNGVNYQFVVRSKAGYFLIDNGTKTGPFKTAPIKSKNISQEFAEENNNVAMG